MADQISVAKWIGSDSDGSTDQITHKSTVESPVRIVWELAEANPNARRCEIIRMAEAAGVATYTARTQYQRWFSWVKEGRPVKK